MFDMSGHSVEFCGARLVGSDPEILREFGIDPEQASMVCWGEDLARIPLLVWDEGGEVIFRNDMLTPEHAALLAGAGVACNRVISEENEAVAKAINS